TIFLHPFDDSDDAIGDERTGDLTAFHGKLYLKQSADLWCSDGTIAGTKLVKSVGAFSIDAIHQLLHTPDALFFISNQQTILWKSDGTTKGTRQIAFDGAHADLAAVCGGRLIVQGSNRKTFATLWASDGTSMTVIDQGDFDTDIHTHDFVDFAGNGYFI